MINIRRKLETTKYGYLPPMAKSSTSGQGRPKGALNKATRALKDLLADDAEAVRKELVRLCLSAESEATRAVAIKEFNDRLYGKPLQQVEVGKPGAFEHMSDHELAAFVRDTEREIRASGPRRAGTAAQEKPESLH